MARQQPSQPVTVKLEWNSPHVFFAEFEGRDECLQPLGAKGTICGRRAASELHIQPEAPAVPFMAVDDERLKQLQGVGPETPLVTTPTGGVHSDIPFRFDLFDPNAMFALAGVLDYGIKRGYKVDNWRYIDTRAHLNHVLMHITAHLAGDTQDNHLAHAFTRMMFAVGVELQGGARHAAD